MSPPPTSDQIMNGLLVQTAPETGQPPRTRVKSAADAIRIYRTLRRADFTSAVNRVSIQAMFDGAPPYDEAFLKSSGQGARCNIDFGEGAELLERSVAPYVDLFYSVERLISVQTKFGPEAKRQEYSDIIAEEWTRMVRKWPALDHSFLFNVHQFVMHGVSVCYFQDELDWRWKVSPFGDFLIPRRTLATEGKFEVACALATYQVHEVYAFIADPEVAKSLGWNVPLVRKAIAKAMPATNGTYSVDNWEMVQTDLKNNDIHYGVTSSEVRFVHTWVQEFSGKVTHLISWEGDDTEEKFIYKKENRFSNMGEVSTFFTYGIGTNGYYHGIRGLGHKVFPLAQYTNRLLGQEMDSAMLASSVMVQPESEEVADNLQMVNYGPYAVISPGMNIVERAAPNLTQSVEPAVNRISMMMQKRAGQYTARPAGGLGERTKFEVAADIQDTATLSLTNLNLFYAPWGRLLKEAFRRTIRKDFLTVEPGGQEVAEFRLRCVKRGVPVEAIESCDIESVRPVRAIGAGSASHRQMVTSELLQLSGQFDDTGRNRVLRDVVATRTGWDKVDVYVPPADGPRPTDADRFAVLENAQMEQGIALPIFSNDLHLTHARIHLGKLNEMVAAVENAQTDIATATPIMLVIHTHTTEHVEAMAGDSTTASEAAMYRQNLQQVGEIIYNGIKHLQKLQRQQAEQQPAEGMPSGQQSQQPTPAEMDQEKWARSLESQILSNRAKIAMLAEKHQFEMSARAQKFAQEQALKDAEVAARLRRGA